MNQINKALQSMSDVQMDWRERRFICHSRKGDRFKKRVHRKAVRSAAKAVVRFHEEWGA